MFCEQCGQQIAEGNKFCEQCGWKVPEAEVATNASAADVAPAEETPTVDVTPVVETPAADVATKAKKGGAGKVVALLLTTIVIVIGLVVAFNFKALANMFHATFDSPEEYYSYIEEQQVEEIVDTYMLYYEELILNSLFGINDKRVEANISVEMSEDLRDLLGMGGVDFEWLEAANLGFNASFDGANISLGAKGGVNNVDILSLNAFMDWADEMMYMQIPELNKTYLAGSMDDLGNSYDEEMWEQYEALKQYLPETKELRELLTKYVTIAVSSLDDVEKSSEKIEVGDITQKCTALEVTIDGDAIQTMTEAILKELIKDKDFEKMIVKFLGMAEEFDYPADPEEAYEDFIEGAEEALESIDELDMGDMEFVMVLYVDGSGNVIGREFETEGMSLSFLMPQKGSDFEMEYEIAIEDYDETITISMDGAGKKKGDKISGEFTVKYGTYSLVDVVVEGYDMKKAKKGESTGSFTISASKALTKLLEAELSSEDAALASAILGYSLQIDMNTNLKGGTVTFSILDGEDVFVKLVVDTKIDKSGKISIPSSKDALDFEDDDDIEEWISEVDWDKFISTLEKAEIPDEYIEFLEDAVEDLE